MALALSILIGVIAFFHLYIMWFEMFAWESRGPKIFRGFPKDLFAPTKAMAANQGLYNGFLAFGLIWTFFIQNAEWKAHISSYFLVCIIIAGVYGAFTADRKIILVQALPALIALILVFVQNKELLGW